MHRACHVVCLFQAWCLSKWLILSWRYIISVLLYIKKSWILRDGIGRWWRYIPESDGDAAWHQDWNLRTSDPRAWPLDTPERNALSVHPWREARKQMWHSHFSPWSSTVPSSKSIGMKSFLGFGFSLSLCLGAQSFEHANVLSEKNNFSALGGPGVAIFGPNDLHPMF